MTEIIKTEEIIPIEQGELGLMVSSILLHSKLKVGTRHNDWIKRRIEEYGFVEGIDFYSNLSKSQPSKYKGGRDRFDYILTLDMAKELAMLENNKVGRIVRRNFIEIEKRYRDWIGFILPNIESERSLFGNIEGYNYIKLLLSCECSVISSSVRRRIRKNPQEFWKNQSGQWIVSERFGRTILANAVVRKLNNEAKQRRIAYKEVKLIHNS